MEELIIEKDNYTSIKSGEITVKKRNGKITIKLW